jgi:hypothetical protein
MFDQDFPKADPAPRGCGEREPGGVYCECGLSSRGRPLEEFLIDPPLPLPEGLDLINKPQLWQRARASGEPALDEEDLPIYDLLLWIGEEFYPYCPDYIEEVKRFGASRRLNPNLDLSLLTHASRMILAHPHALNLRWQEQHPPEACKKAVPGHDVMSVVEKADPGGVERAEGTVRDTPMTSALALQVAGEVETLSAMPEAPVTPPQTGPCLFKLWQLIPQEAAMMVVEAAEEEPNQQQPASAASPPLCLRAVGSTIYQYRPSGEAADGLVPGIFATLPITGFALIRYQDGSVNERAKERLLAGQAARGSFALPHYETDR